MKTIKQKLLLMMLLLIGISGSRSWASSTADATITITPVATVSLTLSPTFYDFGNSVSVNFSTNSATALTLTNNGQVDVAVTKQITVQSSPSGWTAVSSSTAVGMDTYALYVATSTTRPSVGAFVPAQHEFGILNNVTALQGLGGGSPILNNPAGATPSVSLWFRLDTPTTVSSQQERSITVRFTGTAQ